MATAITEQLEERINFGKSAFSFDYPDFLDVQLKSFQEFFRLETTPDKRKAEGLYKVFEEHFSIADTRNQFVLEFLDYFIDPPRYSIAECIKMGQTYSVSLRVKFKLYCTDPDHEDFETIVQEVYLGNVPYMTPKGSFVINGAERVVVSQLHRSPGVFFGQSRHNNGTRLYSARIIPFKGSWMEFTTDINNVMYAYIDRKKKLPVTTLFRAIGYQTDKDILNLFGLAEVVAVKHKDLNKLLGRRLVARVLRTWFEDFVDEDTGELHSIERNEIIIDRDTIIEEEHLDLILDANVDEVVLQSEAVDANDYVIIYNTLQKDTTNSEKEAVEHIYRQLRSAEPPDYETAKNVIEKLFFSDARYDLGGVGRSRLNQRLGLNAPIDQGNLTREDIVSIVRQLIKLINSRADVDDIDHLSNRRVRTVGEQLYNQFSMGFTRMARTIRERMNVRDNEVFTPVDLVNAKTLSAVINSFFGTSQLSQFMDQTNPLAEITHKRRLSALGPGGLSRDRAGFEVRDVHYTHYGRLCTIETPEGPNIGLISSLCVYAKINSLGFIETPYLPVENGKVAIEKQPIYLTAEQEDDQNIAQSRIQIDQKGLILEQKIRVRREGDFPIVDASDVNWVEVGANQIASIAASCIPFLEHNDANRALMGSNMQRQAVPLLRVEAPIVGTGIEARVAQDSRVMLNAESDGEVIYVDAQKIIIRHAQTEAEELVNFDGADRTYWLTKYQKTNQNTCINLKPIVRKGQKIKKGQVLCDGYATDRGELALGKNLMVAFMPWQGYNFEDAIVLSERIVREDLFTTLHIDEYSLEVRETKLGMEELTSDIPNASEESIKQLDENGIVRIGMAIKEGDILIGKVTPKGESDPSPEEKLLKAIFGSKAGDVKDASLKAPVSTKGVVIDKSLYSRVIKDRKAKAQEKLDIEKLEKEYEEQLHQLKKVLIQKLFGVIKDQKSEGVYDSFQEEIIKKGTKFTEKNLFHIDYSSVDTKGWVKDEKDNELIQQIIHNFNIKSSDLLGQHRRKKIQISVGDELPSGIMKLAKVYIAKKRKLMVGDKMAGRHGNKGIVAKIVRDEDMPFLADGTPVDVVLNPLGVPSRMNLGQIYETVLGWVGKETGQHFATPIFDGATLDEINALTDEAGIPRYGSTYLYDGQTGEKFDQPATVGVIYMLKLGHMVDDKMHARSIGPYSMITQQPLGGKAHFGGQRFGEMEVWAIEAYGAANILHEICTIKSDDVVGRAKSYEALVKGDNLPTPGLPESFNVLLNELRGLALDITLE